MRKTGFVVNIIKDYVSRYNFAVSNYNSASFEVNYDEKPKKKKMMKFFGVFQPTLVTIFIISYVYTLVILANNEVIGRLLTGIFLALGLVYFLLVIYNTVVFYRNGSLIASNFFPENKLSTDLVNEFYTIDLQGDFLRAGASIEENNVIAAYMQTYRLSGSIQIMVFTNVYYSYATWPKIVLAFYTIVFLGLSIWSISQLAK